MELAKPEFPGLHRPCWRRADAALPDKKTGGADRFARLLRVIEKDRQLIQRHAPTFIRPVLEGFRQHTLNAAQATVQLGLHGKLDLMQLPQIRGASAEAQRPFLAALS